MKVAVVTNFYPPSAEGGAEIFARDLNDELGRRGFTVEVFTTSHGKARIVQQGNVLVRYFKAPPLPRLVSDVFGYNFNPWARGLVKALSKSSYDILHVHNINSTVMLHPLLAGIRRPIVCHVHDHWPVCYRGVLFVTWRNEPCVAARPSCCFNPGRRTIGRVNLAFRRKLLALFENQVSAFVVPTRHMESALVSRGFTTPDKIRHIRLGLNFEQVPVHQVTRADSFVFAGRLVGYKNPQLLIELARRRGIPRAVKFVILGKGPLESTLRRDAAELEARVIVLGGRPREVVLAQMRRARGVLVPSYVPENSPLVVIESLATGTPVLCSSVGGAKELIEESGGGRTVSANDAVLWEAAIMSLLDTDEFERISRRAAAFAKNELAINRCGDSVAKLYDSLVA